jgi:hypothetical protein
LLKIVMRKLASAIGEIYQGDVLTFMRELSDESEGHAVVVFARNLRSLLLQPPLRGKRPLAIDPGLPIEDLRPMQTRIGQSPVGEHCAARDVRCLSADRARVGYHGARPGAG